MEYTDLIFDLYGTLADIHTEESDGVWEKTAIYFGFHGARYTGVSLKEAFRAAMDRREAAAGQSYECFPDIPFEEVMDELFRAKGVEPGSLGIGAAQLFRISSMEYLRLYPGVKEALGALREKGCRLWLLSNAQAIFTAGELRYLGLDPCFDGVYLSSDYGCRKPDSRFFRALLDGQKLDRSRCLMIGNDRETDIRGAAGAGLHTLYLHTNLTPPDQAPARPGCLPGTPGITAFEYEGCDWAALSQLLCSIQAM